MLGTGLLFNMTGIAAVLLFVAVAFATKSQCPPEQAEDWTIEKLLPHEDCDKFYKCTYGQPVTQLCPPDLLYNIETEQCDHAPNVECGDRNISGPSNPDSNEDSTDESSEEVSPTEVPAPTGAPVPTSAPAESEEEDSSEESEEVELLENGCPVDWSIPRLLPHGKICRLYYVCEHGKRHLRKCPRKLHFNPELQVCDWRDNAGCVAPSKNNVVNN